MTLPRSEASANYGGYKTTITGIAVQEETSVSKIEYEGVVKKLEKEEEEHAKTKNNLDAVSEQLEFALGEIDVLSKQLQREKQAFDSALSHINNKVLKHSIQKDKLISKCSEIENHILKQEDVLNDKENEIKELQLMINRQKQTLKKQASDFKIQKQQECYIAEMKSFLKQHGLWNRHCNPPYFYSEVHPTAVRRAYCQVGSTPGPSSFRLSWIGWPPAHPHTQPTTLLPLLLRGLAKDLSQSHGFCFGVCVLLIEPLNQ
ncbi:spermatogenesis-associated protein 24 isoform X2 [Pogona vitticeps]|uniref:Spermatogenesis-associated protein 24 isoform X2 n=1 Tax=Pogona vitticeps TaxID=103695 RepID=A0ABM5GLZ9_9SAUR